MKKRMTGILSMVGLFAVYLLLRFPLFSLHGMKAWPLDLLTVGAAVIAVSGILQGRKHLPVLTAAGYAVGFALGYVFQFDYGHQQNSLWIIWTGVYLATIVIGTVIEMRQK